MLDNLSTSDVGKINCVLMYGSAILYSSESFLFFKIEVAKSSESVSCAIGKTASGATSVSTAAFSSSFSWMSKQKQHHASCAREFASSLDITQDLVSAQEAGYDFIVIPLVEPSIEKISDSQAASLSSSPINDDALSTCCYNRADFLLNESDWSSLIVARCTQWPLQLSECDAAQERLFTELSYASHLGICAVIINMINGDSLTRLARAVYSHSFGFSSFAIWLDIPICIVSANENDQPISNGCEENGLHGHDFETTWNDWNRFRTLTSYIKRLGILLTINTSIPPPQQILDRWFSEPIKALSISTNIFIKNKKGFPVLPRALHPMMIKACEVGVQFIIRGELIHDKPLSTYFQYINYLWGCKPALDSVSEFARGYENYLQQPLQPLMDNLESQTYAIFEKDPVKYTRYQEAIYNALKTLDESLEKPILMVLGAGRGPLVACSLAAAEQADKTVRVVAIEKNPNAVVTLRHRLMTEWENKDVRVECADMRTLGDSLKADIIISELLGSFSDNELSPECLDGARLCLKSNAISIPSSYTSYLQPISSHRVFYEAQNAREFDKPWYTPLETPFVVRLTNYLAVSQSLPLFTFTHPNPDAGHDQNSRYKSLNFMADQDCVIHGFAGYFNTVLYDDVKLSIVPGEHSEGMFSWFSMFFPIRSPFKVLRGENIEIHFWRCATKQKVWYEWCVTSPVVSEIHNPNGRSYFIGK